MKKRIITMILAISMIICAMPVMASAAGLPSIDDKAVLYTPSKDYRGGDCILTATKTMIRRLAIMNGSSNWSTITNAAIRRYAAPSGLLKFTFSYTNDGIRYDISHGYFKGKTEAAKRAEIAALLKEHPEGIVVWGSRATKYNGPHGVLAVRVDGNTVYAVDSAFNKGLLKFGSQPWATTIMGNLNKCSKYWCIKSHTGSAVNTNKGESILSISDVRAPSSIKQGKGFTIKGDIYSNYKIKSVTVSITDKKGTAVISKTVKPESWSYSVLSMDKEVKFGTLAAGEYTYKISAKDEKKTLKLHENKFEVTAPEVTQMKTSSLRLESPRVPEKIQQGKGFTIKGIVKSDSKIKSVIVSVIDEKGNTMLEASATPGKKSYDILKLDRKVKFGKLGKGTYTYQVVAKDASQQLTLIEKQFKVN